MRKPAACATAEAAEADAAHVDAVVFRHRPETVPDLLVIAAAAFHRAVALRRLGMVARIAAGAELDAVPRALAGIVASVGSVAGPTYPDRPARPGARVRPCWRSGGRSRARAGGGRLIADPCRLPPRQAGQPGPVAIPPPPRPGTAQAASRPCRLSRRRN
jgi:hypothetical protein